MVPRLAVAGKGLHVKITREVSVRVEKLREFQDACSLKTDAAPPRHQKRALHASEFLAGYAVPGLRYFALALSNVLKNLSSFSW